MRASSPRKVCSAEREEQLNGGAEARRRAHEERKGAKGSKL